MRGEFVDVGGRRIYYYAAGTRGEGVPVILLHGFPASSRLWHTVVRDFPPGHRLVVVDLPGYGRSDPGPVGAGCGQLADTVLALMDDLRVPRAALVGHGIGGGVAQAVAVREPGRVSHLALVDSAAFGHGPARMARLARALGPLTSLLPPGLLAGLVQGSIRSGFADPDRHRLTLDTWLQPFTSVRGRDLLAAHLRLLRHCDTGEVTPRLATLGIPTTIVWGADDPYYPPALARRLQAAIPGAALDIVEDASHFTPEDAPERVLKAVVELLGR